MIKYDKVVTFGCSFMNGDAIQNINGNPAGKDFAPHLELGRLFNCNSENQASSGFSNERIVKRVYEWIESNKESKNTLFVIGLSELSRVMIYADMVKMFYDLQPGQLASYSDDALEHNAKKFGASSGEELKSYMAYYIKYFYNEEVEIKKLHRMILGMSAYLNANNINYIIFNSLPANLDGIRDKINFMSFNDDDYSGRDTWNDFLMWQTEHIDGNKYNDEIYRSPKPPYGKQYCNGHPSPNAIKKLCERIYKELNK